MRSLKKPASMLVALVAIAVLAVPALASASSLEYNGKLVPVGAVVTGSSTNAGWNSIFGNKVCNGWTVTEKVTKNDGTTVEAQSAAEGKVTECFHNGNPLPVTSSSWNNFVTTTPGKGTVAMAFTAKFGEVTCELSSAALPFTYVPGSSSITFNKAPLNASHPACKGTFHGTFQLAANSALLTLK